VKKLLVGIALAGSLASGDFIGASGGVGIWSQNIDGYVKTGDNINYFNNKSAEKDGDKKTGNLGLSDEQKLYIWAKIIHPIPFIPNLKLQYTQYDTKGKGVATSNFKIFGESISLKDKVETEITIDSYDTTFFYELNPVIADFEGGVGVNILDGKIDVKTALQKESKDWLVPLPYLYGRVETMNIGGFSVEAQIKYFNISKGHYYDYQGALKYHLFLPVDISASIGYKKQDIYGEDGDNSTKIKFEGGFVELGVKW